VQTFKNESHVYIDVIDYGKRRHKTRSFAIISTIFSTEINGTGLGLYLSQTICEANQAKLIYVEQKQQGACFRIECPLMD
jgi:two-component system sensor histidine kinase PilS (NtrC family)